MIITYYDQGTDAWLNSRLGVLTASVIDKVVTPTGKLSAQRTALMCKLAAERITGLGTESYKSEWMERGNEVEHRAIEVFEFMTDFDTHQTGLIYKDDDMKIGISPDSLVEMPDGIAGLEAKSPSPGVHIEYLLGGVVPAKYWPQVQFSLWVTGFDRWFFVSNHDDLRPLILEVLPDKDYQSALDKAVPDFISELDAAVLKIAA